MSDFIYIFASALAGFHALTFARWLRLNGNKKGAYGVFALILVSLALPILRLLSQ
ncbi:hypothetical protein [Anaeroselena agilis]|uniref:Uncharacterized protein n=1 Tax=Anaeroselena agilis TaxID=3063788 RepID=A0ABU3NWM4_9FIRM|nr:hypothetical protein [Selenomonadales bacterium 4137-cl]